MSALPPAPARELVAPVSLTRPDGRLDPAAVGWARHPLVDTSGIGRGRWGRNKRWEYWNITTPTHIMALTVSSIDYAAVHEVWVFDRATQKTWSRTSMTVPARGVEFAPSFERGPTGARARGLEIGIDPSSDGSGTRLRARIADASFDVVADLPEGHERLCVVVPWSEDRFQYTVKDVARPAHGTLTIEGATYDVPAGASWAVLDHGRGRWPYGVRWNWGAGSGVSYGRVIGIQVGGGWTEGTGMTENAITIDGRLHKIHAELEWRYDIGEWQQPWHVGGGGLDASFTPFYDKSKHVSIGVISSSTDQCFGHWSGTFRTADGQDIPFDDVLGWAEEAHIRW